MGAYQDFLAAKAVVAGAVGVDVDASEVNPRLKPHARAIVPWAVKGGRRAIFARFGLQKTSMQLEILRILGERTGGPVLAVVPLGVRQEFKRDAETYFDGLRTKFIRSADEIEAGSGIVHLTNYETIRDGKLDPRLFKAASLDEASVLRGFGGTKTFREFMRLFESVPYRFVATATPDPNEFIELLAYSAFLGVMDVGEAKTRFFKRDSTKADKLTLHAHKEREFWLWVASWAVFIQRPSDLGFSDEGYDLPELDVRWHEIPSDHSAAGTDTRGQGLIFRDAAIGVVQAAAEKRDSLEGRVARLVEALNEKQSGVRAGLLPEESRPTLGAAERAGPAQLQSQSAGLQRPPEEEHAEEVRAHAEQLPGLAGQPGRMLRDLREELPCAPDGGRPLSPDGQSARDPLLAVQPGAGPARGHAGGPLGRGPVPEEHQFIIWCDLNDEQRAVERALDGLGLTHSSLYGVQAIEDREELMEEWRDRKRCAFVSKPVMYGSGVNMQQCCEMFFLGVSFKFSDTIQAVHRILRYGQRRRCTVHFIYTEAEREVRRTLEEKWARYEHQAESMGAIIREYGLAHEALADELRRSIGLTRSEASGERWRAVNADCVEETARMESASVGLILTSIPFSTQYEYSASYNDFGHNEDTDAFWRQMDFLTPELFRVLQPGRVAAIHVKDRIVPGGLSGLGFQTVSPFHAEAIAHYTRHGFAYLGMKTIATDVVRENNQTYRLGWSEQCKDGSRMGVGMPEYLLLFRRPPTDSSNGYADVPVVKEKPLCGDKGEPAPFDSVDNWKHPIPGTGYSRGRWQLDAHGFARSSGDRLLTPDELRNLPHSTIYKLWRERSSRHVYNYEAHVALCEQLDRDRRLPATFMLLPPHSSNEGVWSDVTRMRTLNGSQWAAGREMHLCPMQFDIANRTIRQFSMPGEIVLDPFGGLMTVPLCAVQLGRFGLGIELARNYWLDGVAYLRGAEEKLSTPTLFDALEDPEGEIVPDEASSFEFMPNREVVA